MFNQGTFSTYLTCAKCFPSHVKYVTCAPCAKYVNEDNHTTISRFLSGLKLEIRKKVELLPYKD